MGRKRESGLIKIRGSFATVYDPIWGFPKKSIPLENVEEIRPDSPVNNVSHIKYTNFEDSEVMRDVRVNIDGQMAHIYDGMGHYKKSVPASSINHIKPTCPAVHKLVDIHLK